jgi:hypothetical protein
MKKRLGNFLLLVGLICLVIFFTSSAFIIEDAWFFIGGLGFSSLGMLIRRSALPRRDRQKKERRKHRRVKDQDDE